MTVSGNGQTGGAATIAWLASDEISDALAERWQMPSIAPETLAMLQYTSGSTSQPKESWSATPI